jgi:uncharacterized iron-regulated membrane protein
LSTRRWFEWHSWIGTTAGLLLFVICWSGTVAVFSEEIDWLLNPAERVEPAGEMRSWGEWQRAAERAYPGLRVDSIIAPRSPRSAAELWLQTSEGQTLRTYVDPYTAEVTGQTSYFNVQRFFRSLHMCLFDPGSRGFGYYFVMSFSLVLVASLVTSLVFYKRWWQRFFVLHVHSTARAFWSDLHKLAGVWSLWFLALMAITGVWYLIVFAGVDFAYPEIAPVHRAEPLPWRPINSLLEAARDVAPQLQIGRVYLPGGYYGDIAVLHGQGDASLVRDRANTVVLDAYSGAPMLIRSASDLGWPMRWVDTADPLHFGNFAGLIGKTIWFAFGLLLSGLALTGAYLHARRQQRHRHVVARRRSILIAYAFTLIVLCIATVGAVQEHSTYAPVPTLHAVWAFIGLWLVTCALALTLWMHKVR